MIVQQPRFRLLNFSNTLISLFLVCFISACGGGDDDNDPPLEFTLSVAVNGSGTVTSSPSGINCSSDCSEDYSENTTVTLTADAAEGFEFSGWSGACSGAASCSVTMGNAQSVTATFEQIETQVNLAVNKVGQGSVSSSPVGIDCGADCSQDYLLDTQVTLTVTPDNGWQFDGWTGACSGNNNCVLTMNEALSVTATFSEIDVGVDEFSLSVISSGNGTVNSSPVGINCGTDCSETYTENTVVTLTATPDTGYELQSWSGACSGNSTCQVTMSGNLIVRATFEGTQDEEVSFRIGKNGSGSGSVKSLPVGIDCGSTCEATFPKDSGNVSLVAVADEGSEFAGWNNGCEDNNLATCILDTNNDESLTATFNTVPTEPENVSIIIDTTGSGEGIVLSEPAGINCGSQCQAEFNKNVGKVTLAAVVAEGSVFIGWGGACSGTNEKCELITDENHLVTAEFNKKGDGKEYYIDPVRGSDSNRGSIDSPWETTRHAFNELRAGDVLNFFEGNYSAMNNIPGGTLGNPVTLRAIKGENVVITDSSSNNGMVFTNDHVVVDGFEISGTKVNGVNIQANHITIRNCLIHHTGTGVKSSSSTKNHHILIDGCTFYWFKDITIFPDEVEKFVVRNSLFQESASVTMDPGGAEDLLIENNLVDQDDRGLGPLKLRWGNVEKVNEPNNNGAIIRNNIFMEGEKYTVLLASANGAMMYNNVLVSNLVTGRLNKGLLYTQLDPSASPGNPNGPNKYNVVKNNIFLINGGDNPQGSRHQVLFDVDTDMDNDLPTWKIDFNLYYKSRGNEYIRNRGIIRKDSVVGWGSNFDRNSIVDQDPLFSALDPVESPSEYRPKVGSPAIDAGVHLTETVGSGTSTVVKVKDSRYFFGGYGMMKGDEIQIGSTTATVIDRDIKNNTLTLDRSITWQSDEKVTFAYKGSAPDIGVFENGEEKTIATAFGASRFYAFTKGIRLPNQPIDLSLSARGKATINVEWTDRADDEDGFVIQRSPTGYSQWRDVGTSSANDGMFTDNSVSCGTEYYYRVKANNVAGNSNATHIERVRSGDC